MDESERVLSATE